MKKALLSIALVSSALATSAQGKTDEALWMRYPAISPDGTTIAFSFGGNIYTVPVGGGRALQLTTHAAYDYRPVWSPDSRHIAFASDRMGSLDVFVIDREGGVPTRLTTHSGAEVPVAFRGNDRVLFTANQLPSATSLQFAGSAFPQVYEVGLKGGRASTFSTLPMEDINFATDGRSFLYHDKKGYEDPWRKHQTSSIARDVWMARVEKGGKFQQTKLTNFAGEDRNPVFTPDGKAFYYLSEQNGTFNVMKADFKGTPAQAITSHKHHPVRFLTAASNGTLCYGWDGGIYTLQEGGQPQKVDIRIVSDKTDRDVIKMVRASGATEFALSPDEKEVAFILHGDVYVTSVEYGTTKRITNTPEQERNIDFAPNGRALVYAAERNGLWQIYQSSIVKKEEKQFTYATEIKEEQLVKSTKASFQPDYSPNGKEVAFLEDRTTLRVVNLQSKEVRTVMEGTWEYSYTDGDQNFQWSPDSRYILTGYIGRGGWNNKDIALVDVTGKKPIVNLTESGYSDSNPRWVLDGKAMLWESDRAGYRSHGSWGAESDYYLMFFDLDAYEHFYMSKEELALAEAAKAEAKKAEDAKKKAAADKAKKNKKSKDKADDKAEEKKPLELDLDNRFDRIVRLTVHSARMGDAVLSPKGDKLFYQAAFEDAADLWEQDLRENKTRLIAKRVGRSGMVIDKTGDNIYLVSSGIKKLNTKSGQQTEVKFAADFNYRPADERAYIFDHAWQQTKDKFYKADMHGVDWDFYRQAYRRFLPSINNNYDFAELLSEMLGELNASHTGARYAGGYGAMGVAQLGAFFDESYQGDGLRVKEVMARGPFAVRNTGVGEGSIIEAIDGEKITAGMDYFPLLEGKAGKKVRLTIYNPDSGKRSEQVVKAISAGEQNELLYKRWVKRNEEMVHRLSNGQIAYVHVRGMNSPSFRDVYSDLLSEANRQRKAVIVDTRHNGGGWLHDDLITLLTGKEYQQFVPRGQYIGSDPFSKWLKPSCLLVCEDNYSNASGFPVIYQALGVGKVIGAPIPGTMTAVWWERQIDPSIVFGIPQVGVRDMKGVFGENTELQPDILVYNKPEEVEAGIDRQIEAAVKHLLEVTAKQ